MWNCHCWLKVNLAKSKWLGKWVLAGWVFGWLKGGEEVGHVLGVLEQR